MRKLGTIGLVLVGLLISVESLRYANNAVWVVCTSDRPTGGRTLIEASLLLLSAAAVLVFGVLLIRNRSSLSDRWFSDGETSDTVDLVSVLRAGLVLMGVWLVATQMPQTISSVGQLATYYLDDVSEPGNYLFYWHRASSVLLPLLEAGVGVLLILRSEQLASRLLRRGKDAGTA